MKAFLSWTGEQSRLFAEELKPWLEQVLPTTEVFLSSEDIDKGTFWFSEVITELEECNCGIICITRENHLSPWLHFEAGGMVKGLGKGHVVTVLLDLDYSDLRPPLSLFNGLRVNRQGVWHLIKAFNKISDRPIKDKVLERGFDRFWPDLDNAYKLLFPDSRAAALDEPLHMAPDPAASIITPPPARPVRKHRKPAHAQPGLFNGEE